MPNFGLQRTPPGSGSTSTPDLTLGENMDFVNPRKRPISALCDHSELKKELTKSLDEWKAQFQTSMAVVIQQSIQQSIVNELGNLTAAVTNIQSEVKTLSTNFQTIKSTLSDVTSRVSNLESHANYMHDLSTVPADIATIKEEYTNQLSCLKSENSLLSKRLDDMEQYSRQTNIEIRNLPERKNEYLDGIMINLGKILKLPIAAGDIVFAHRVPHAHKYTDGEKQAPKNVIVKFHSRTLRDNIIAASKQHRAGINTEQLQLAGTPTKIFINEHLTLKRKILFRQTKERCTAKKYKFVWVKNASIMARKDDTSPVVFVRSESDLDKIV